MGQGAVTKDKILKAALKIFSQYGFEGARMEKIAAEVGINKASLYFHFKSKEIIFRELFQDIIGKYQTKLQSIIEQSKGFSSKERLIRIYQDYLKYHWNNTEMDFWNMIYYFPPQMMKDEILQITIVNNETFIANLIMIMEEGIQKKELKPLVAQSMAKSYYYLLTCISLSTDLMSLEQGIADMDRSFEVLWDGIKGM